MIRDSLHFMYDNIKSRDMGVLQVSTDSGLFEEHFLADRTINEEKIRGRDKPYFKDIERDTLVIPLSLWFEKGMSDEKVRQVARWINQKYYKPLWFENNGGRIYYAMYQGSARSLHNGIEEGYVQIEMKCNAPYAFSPVYTSEIYDLSNNPIQGTIIDFTNNGDEECSPLIFIECTSDTDISITNLSNGGEMLEISGLYADEKIKIDCENQEIETDIVGRYLYDNSNDVFLSIPRGVNKINLKGKCKIQFKYEFII